MSNLHRQVRRPEAPSYNERGESSSASGLIASASRRLRRDSRSALSYAGVSSDSCQFKLGGAPNGITFFRGGLAADCATSPNALSSTPRRLAAAAALHRTCPVTTTRDIAPPAPSGRIIFAPSSICTTPLVTAWVRTPSKNTNGAFSDAKAVSLFIRTPSATIRFLPGSTPLIQTMAE